MYRCDEDPATPVAGPGLGDALSSRRVGVQPAGEPDLLCSANADAYKAAPAETPGLLVEFALSFDPPRPWPRVYDCCEAGADARP